MRRAIATSLVLAAALAAIVLLAGGDDDRYLIRAGFDNAGFLVPGEDVRIAGANVGRVDEVGVSEPDEWISRKPGVNRRGGKAFVVLEITDPGFQDFRRGASCLVRPQSLLGERYVECLPVRPGRAGAAPLAVVPPGERGAGQHLLPIEDNGRAVDLDIVTNIMRRPEVDRFRLILNELGAGLAARGPELAAVIRRANPGLRELDRVLTTLAGERRRLRALARDAELALAPLARERRSLSRFISSAGSVAGTAAERRAQLEAGIAELGPALRELRTTSGRLESLAIEARPLARDLSAAAPALAGALAQTPDLAGATENALTSLATEGTEAAGDLVASEPVIGKLSRLAKSAAPGARSLEKLLSSLRSNAGYEHLFDLIYNTSGAFNGYDELGHFLRAEVLVSNCVDYVTTPLSGCGANFTGPARASSETTSAAATRRMLEFALGPEKGGDRE